MFTIQSECVVRNCKCENANAATPVYDTSHNLTGPGCWFTRDAISAISNGTTGVTCPLH